MMDRDMRPTRFDLSLQYAREFVVEWFDQNPLGQIGLVGMRGGIGERIGEMSGRIVCPDLRCLCSHMFTGNPQDVLKSLSDRTKLEPVGEPSLQNAIEMARSSMRSVQFAVASFWVLSAAVTSPLTRHARFSSSLAR